MSETRVWKIWRRGQGAKRVLLAAVVACAVASLPLHAVETPEIAQPGEPIDSPLAIAPWVRLFARVASAKTLYSDFREERRFNLKKEPVRLSGQMRFSVDHGLSLAYTKPETRILILDDAGIVMRDAKGRDRVPPAGSEAGGIIQALRSVVELDLQDIVERFDVRGARSEDVWRLDLNPHSEEFRKRIGSFIVWGEGERVRHIQMRRADGQKVDVFIERSEMDRVFNADEIHRFFRRGK